MQKQESKNDPLTFRVKTSVALICSLVIALVVHVYGSPVVSYHVPSDSKEGGICQPTQCVQNHQQLICDDCIPLVVADTVNEIVLTSLHEYHLVVHGFCKVTWANVTKLSIINDLEDQTNYTIVDYAFDCLNKIESLKLNIRKLSNMTTNTLYGLLNVRSLDFTDCSWLETPALISAFSLGTIVPKLDKLILSNMGSALFNGIQLSQTFIDALAQRNITELNLSLTYVEFVNESFGGLCETLQTFNVSKARILYTSIIPREVCDALQIVDFSGTQFPQAIFLKKNVTIKGSWQLNYLWFEFFSRTSVLYLNELVSPDHYIYILDSNVTFAVNNTITEVHLSGYNSPIFEVEIMFSPNHLTYLDLSNNRIERIGADTFRSLKYLRKLDLSYNNLGTASNDKLIVLFRNNMKLVNLALAYNGLTCLPQKVFELNNQLEQLDLRGNKIKQIDFEISNLTSLTNMDLRGNLIEYLDASSRQQIDTLFHNKQTINAIMDRNGSFVVDIRNNPFSCKCHSLDFIVWFINSPIFENSRGNYHCEIDGQHILMNTNAITAARYECGKPARKVRNILIFTLVPCVTLSIVIAVSILLFKRYRYFKNLQKLRKNISLILEETFLYRFPVFLSYASVDSQFVEEHIHLPLKVCFGVKAPINVVPERERETHQFIKRPIRPSLINNRHQFFA